MFERFYSVSFERIPEIKKTLYPRCSFLLVMKSQLILKNVTVHLRRYTLKLIFDLCYWRIKQKNSRGALSETRVRVEALTPVCFRIIFITLCSLKCRLRLSD